MAAPTPVVRLAPTGHELPDGFGSKIAFARDPDIQLFEKSTTPPSPDGGDPIDISTHYNARYRTKAERALIELGNGAAVCAYDPAAYLAILELINEPGAISEIFPDGSVLTYFGYLKGADFGPLVDGTFPEVTLDIVVTNRDPVNKVEAGPVLSSVAGT